MEYQENIYCPIVERTIDAFSCIVVSDIADGLMPEVIAPEGFIGSDTWKAVCLGCPCHDKTN